MKRKLTALLLAVITALLASCEKDAPVNAIPPDTHLEPSESNTLSADPDEYIPTEGTETEEKVPAAFELTGKLQSATGTKLNLYVDWVAAREAGSDKVRVAAHLSVGHAYLICNGFSGSFSVGDKSVKFETPDIDHRSSSFTRDYIKTIVVEVQCGAGEAADIDVSVSWNFAGSYGNREFKGIDFKGTIPVGARYTALKNSVSHSAELIKQKPELPEGCEVTSLAMLLRKLGFDISHTALSDDYLPKGEVGVTSFYEKNVGNPRNAGRAFGCYAPVIVKTANSYLSWQDTDYRAYDLSGYDVSEVYRHLSEGRCAVVWVTEDFADVFVKADKYWIIDGKRLYWKYPLHCVLLTGYDKTLGTVSILDPLKNEPVTAPMSLFEEAYRQMESQAVVIMHSEPLK